VSKRLRIFQLWLFRVWRRRFVPGLPFQLWLFRLWRRLRFVSGLPFPLWLRLWLFRRLLVL
jgi:hypothetical protein